MKNYVQTGDNLTLPSPYDVSSGGGALVGSIFGVAAGDALTGADVDLVTRGVFTLDKVAVDAFTIGEPAYWDDVQQLVTVDPTGNTKIGVAVEAAAGGSATVAIRLNGSF